MNWGEQSLKNISYVCVSANKLCPPLKVFSLFFLTYCSLPSSRRVYYAAVSFHQKQRHGGQAETGRKDGDWGGGGGDIWQGFLLYGYSGLLEHRSRDNWKGHIFLLQLLLKKNKTFSQSGVFRRLSVPEVWYCNFYYRPIR